MDNALLRGSQQRTLTTEEWKEGKVNPFLLRVRSWLRTNAGGVPYACKSSGLGGNSWLAANG